MSKQPAPPQPGGEMPSRAHGAAPQPGGEMPSRAHGANAAPQPGGETPSRARGANPAPQPGREAPSRARGASAAPANQRSTSRARNASAQSERHSVPGAPHDGAGTSAAMAAHGGRQHHSVYMDPKYVAGQTTEETRGRPGLHEAGQLPGHGGVRFTTQPAPAAPRPKPRYVPPAQRRRDPPPSAAPPRSATEQPPVYGPPPYGGVPEERQAAARPATEQPPAHGRPPYGGVPEERQAAARPATDQPSAYGRPPYGGVGKERQAAARPAMEQPPAYGRPSYGGVREESSATAAPGGAPPRGDRHAAPGGVHLLPGSILGRIAGGLPKRGRSSGTPDGVAPPRGRSSGTPDGVAPPRGRSSATPDGVAQPRKLDSKKTIERVSTLDKEDHTGTEAAPAPALAPVPAPGGSPLPRHPHERDGHPTHPQQEQHPRPPHGREDGHSHPQEEQHPGAATAAATGPSWGKKWHQSPMLPSERRRRKKRPVAFCFTLCCILFWLLVIGIGLAILVVYLLYHPQPPRLRVTTANLNAGYIDQLPAPRRGLALNSDLYVLAAISNPNTKIDVVLLYMQLDLYFQGRLIGTQAVWPPVREEPSASTIRTVHLVVSEVALSQEDAETWQNATTKGGPVQMQLSGRFHAQLNFGRWLPFRYWIYPSCTLWLDPPPGGALRRARCRQ